MWTFMVLFLTLLIRANANFKWRDCAPQTAPMHVQSFHMTPDPVSLPGHVYVTASGSTVGRINDATVVLTLKKRHALFGFDLSVPCINNVGSCTYQSVCTILSDMSNPTFAGQDMANIAKGLKEFCDREAIDCGCPLSTGNFTITNHRFSLPSIPAEFLQIGNFLSGDYTFEIKFLDKTSTQNILFCTQGDFSIHLNGTHSASVCSDTACVGR